MYVAVDWCCRPVSRQNSVMGRPRGARTVRSLEKYINFISWVRSNLAAPHIPSVCHSLKAETHLTFQRLILSTNLQNSPCIYGSIMSGLLKPFRRRRQQEQPGTPRTKTSEPTSRRTSPRPRIESPPGTRAGLPQRGLQQTFEYLDVSKDANPLLVEAKKKYNEAIMEFDKVFELYASKQPNVMRLNANGIAEATHRALSCADASQSGKVFGEAVQKILQTTKADQMQRSVGKEVCSVLSKLFPLMKLALGLTESVAEV
jgi:hypothetical protein